MATSKTYLIETITAAGLTIAYDINDHVDEYNIIPSGGGITLTGGNVVISPSGTPFTQDTYTFRYAGGITVGAFSVTFFGVALTAAQALYQQDIVAIYNGATWDVSISSDMSSGAQNINGADIVAASIPSTALAGSIALTKLAATGIRGQAVRTGVNGVVEVVSAAVNTTVVGGDGIDVGPQVVGGDLTKASATWTIANNAITTVKILNDSVTASKVSTELKTEVLIIPCSFEGIEIGAITYVIPFACSVTAIRAVATKLIEITDDATVVLKDNGGTIMTVTTPISFGGGDTLGTAYSSAITANNTFTAGQILTVLTAKVTAGGGAHLSLTVLRS
jgi:hypothetical protein